jgi:hypothetical protein
MVNISTNFNKSNYRYYISLLVIGCKKVHNTYRWKYMSWFGSVTNMWRGVKTANGISTPHLDNWISHSITFLVTVHYIIKLLYKDVMACDLMELL